MKIRALIAAATALAALSAAAVGATATPLQQCTALEKQFDQEIVTHGAMARAAQAKTLRADGEKLCKSGKPKTGVRRLEDALDDIGVTPRF